MSTILWLKPDEIVVEPDRQRKEFNQAKIDALAKSIADYGQINTILVEKVDGTYVLRAGERRLRAGRQLHGLGLEITCGGDTGPIGTVPCLAVNDLDPIARHAVELEENIQREDLTWQERAAAITELHNLRNHQTGGTQTIAKTAVEIGDTSRATVSEALIVSKHLADPEVAKAKTQREALKVIEKKAAQEHRAILAKTFDLSATPHTLLLGDCFAELAKFPPAIFDHICTDPPYKMNADSFGSQAGTGHNYNDGDKDAIQFFDRLAAETFRVSKDNSFLYLFCDLRWFDRLDITFSLAGWNVWHKPLIWDKCGNGMLPEPDYGPRYTYECILYARKGSRRVIKPGAPDVLSHSPVRNLLHGAQKPVELYVDLLSRVANPGDKVLDMFVGSGTIFPAANRLKLTATGVEQLEVNYNIALTRMNEKELDNDTGAQGADSEAELIIPGIDG